MREIYKKIYDLLNKNERFAVATIVRTQGSTPRNVGAKMIIMESGSIQGSIGGGKTETIVVSEACKALENGKPNFLTFRLDKDSNIGSLCGGNMDVYIEPIERQLSIILIGGGHIGRYVAKIAKMCDFSTLVIDPSASKEQFPEADTVISKDPVAGLADLDIVRDTCIVIATGSHEIDEQVLRKVLDYEVAYLGMIGSRNKVRTIFKNLCDSGIPKERLKKIHSPIGLDIGAETASEIAVSIVAEIISTVRDRSAMPLSKTESL